MEPAKPFFDEWADLYDADYREQDIGDVDFYVDLATRADGPVLEVGCGTGRVYLELLRAGVDADGIDLSADMLGVLEEKAQEAGLEPSVWQADMRTFSADRSYALIIVPFRSFLHNVDLVDQVATLRQLRDALQPGGQLALNVFVPRFDVICETYGTEQERTVERDGESFVITDRSRIVDEVEQEVEVRRRLERDGEILRESTFRLGLIPKQQFELLVAQTGWSDWTAYGGFDGQPLEDGASEMVWLLDR